MELLKSEVGCVACMQDMQYVTPCDVHHLIDGSRRRGHGYTVSLCAWHHRGVDPRPGQELLPSLARDPAAFKERYGEDDDLLRLADSALHAIEANTVSGI